MDPAASAMRYKGIVRSLVACVALFFLASLHIARADEAPVVLSVKRATGAEDCPDGPALIDAVTRSLGRQALTTEAQRPSVSTYNVAFSREPSGYQATIHVTGPRAGELAVSDPSSTCVALGDATVLTLSLLLDPDAIVTAPVAPVPSAAPRPPPSPTPLPPRPQVEPPISAPVTDTLLLHAGAGISAALVRPVAPLLSAGASWDRERWSLGLDALWVPTQSLTLAPGKVDVSFVAAQAAACLFAVGTRRLVRVGGCFLPAAGALFASGQSYTRQSSATRPSFAAGLAPSIDGTILGRLGWRARAGGALPLTAEGFSIDNVGTAYNPPAVAAFCDLGLSVAIW